MDVLGAYFAGSFALCMMLAEPSSKPSVISLPSPNFDERPPGTLIEAIVIHDTNAKGISQAKRIANHFLNPASKVSAHYVIGKAGEIVQCVPDEKRAWHAGISQLGGREHVNDFSIGIELVNDETGTDPFTEEQYSSLSKLVSYLLLLYPIPNGNVVGHRGIALPLGIKHDPADNFDWLYFWQKTRALLPR
jgi:N-acetylmuramoyl-L-alanine amidase